MLTYMSLCVSVCARDACIYFSFFFKKNSNLKAFNQVANEIQKKRIEYKFSDSMWSSDWINQEKDQWRKQEFHFWFIFNLSTCICKCTLYCTGYTSRMGSLCVNGSGINITYSTIKQTPIDLISIYILFLTQRRKSTHRVLLLNEMHDTKVPTR